MAASEKHWLITGVSSGLGRALAAVVLASGDRVSGTVRSPQDKDLFESGAPGRAHGYLLDVRDEAAITAMVGALGSIDVLVNNAGFGLVGAIEEASLAEARDQFEVNVFGPLRLIQAVLPAMRACGAGVIVNITSVSGLTTWQGTGIYCASKFALEAIGDTLADEVATLGIKVMNVEPGGMRTDYVSRSLKRAGQKLDCYDQTAHASERILSDHAGHESGDPMKMAGHILDAVRQKAPPRHLLLGADAVHYATRKMAALLTEIGEGAAISVDTRFDR